MIQNQPFKLRLRVKISSQYRPEPVIYTLIARYRLKINIHAAILGPNPNTEGWFDLELTGTKVTVPAALKYLKELGIEFWTDEGIRGWW